MMAYAMLSYILYVLPLLHISPASCAPSPRLLQLLGPQGVNLWKLQSGAVETASGSTRSQASPALVVQDPQWLDAPTRTMDFRAQWFQQPLDHFSNDSLHTFHQRYWVNDRHYVPNGGGPVIVLDGGETSGEDRLPFLDTGIVDILAQATGGVGVVLEHRYYGASIPVNNFSTDSLRWLDNEQSAADSANFMANVRFDGISEDLTAPGTPWIYYGGSYAGARAAHMKVLYPELVFGSIASSAVTHASITNWEYMDVIRIYADPKCSTRLESSIKTIDLILDGRIFAPRIKALFGLAGLKHDEDFVAVLESPLGEWQSKNWDPEVGTTTFDEFCMALNKGFGPIEADLADLPFNHTSRMVALGPGFSADLSIVNYANWIKANIVSQCHEGLTVEQCFGTYDDAKYQMVTLDQDWRLWLFQVCTQWGYFTTAPPNMLHPRIISRRLTLEYESKICKQAFPPGKYFTVPSLPNVTAVNALGDFDLAADRLAFIDGEVDPWRPDTPHSTNAKNRTDTISRPFKLIPNAVHHWDENGLSNLLTEPPDIRKIHGEMIHFVTEWLKESKKDI